MAAGERISAVAARYGGALFDLAREKGVLDSVVRDVETLGRALAEPAAAAFLADGRVPLSEKRARLRDLARGFHELSSNFVQLVLDKRRVEVLAELAPAFRRRQLSERGAVEGVVQTPRPLSAADVGELAVALGRRLGREVLLENQIVPELVGGVRVFVQNRMLDHSVQGRLSGLRDHLRSVPVSGRG